MATAQYWLCLFFIQEQLAIEERDVWLPANMIRDGVWTRLYKHLYANILNKLLILILLLFYK